MQTGKFGNKSASKKKAFNRQYILSVEELERPYLKLVYFNPYLSVRKY